MAAETPQFMGMSPDYFAFFRELEQHNSREWFDRNRTRYEELVGAFRALLARLEPELRKLNPEFDTAGKVNGNFSRINRDIRFHRDRAPYNTNYYLYVYDRRRGRKRDGRLYVGLSARTFTLGFSIYAQERDGALLNVFRPRLETDLAALQRWLSHYVTRRRYDCYWYKTEKKSWVKVDGLPKTPEEWKQVAGLVVRKVLRPAHPGLFSASLAHEIELTFERLYPLYAFTSIEGKGWKKHFSAGAARAASR